MVEEKWRELGSLLGDLALYGYIAIVFALVIILTIYHICRSGTRRKLPMMKKELSYRCLLYLRGYF
ncbi:MAG: hypothetical protein II695_01945 [Oscillospiraceae bacterium]|nr:hypothetical protein [Oscillospiraceae bacterium]